MQVRKKPRVVVVALDINKWNPGYLTYRRMSAKKIIKKIERSTEAICEELIKTESQSRIIVGWREHAITDGFFHRAVTDWATNKLKLAMKRLISKYPNLIIMAGGMSVLRQKTDDALKTIAESYKTNKLLNLTRAFEQTLDAQQYIDPYQVNRHEQKVKKLQKKPSSSGISVIRKSAYYAFKDNKEIIIKRSDKRAPYRETDYEASKRKVFQPPKKVFPFFTTSNELGELNLEQEICRDIVMPLKPTCGTLPNICFLSSDTIDLMPENLCAQYAVQFDSVVYPRLVLVDPRRVDGISPNDIILFVSDLLAESTSLKGPFKAISVFANTILCALDKLIIDFNTDEEKKAILKKIRSIFTDEVLSTDQDLCVLLSNLLLKHEDRLINKRHFIGFFGQHEVGLVFTLPDPLMISSVQELRKLIQAQKDLLSKSVEDEEKNTQNYRL